MTEVSLNIAIKTVNNEIYNLTIDRNARIDAIKAQLHERTTIAVNRQRLIYRGRVLQDEATLAEYNIEEGHTVHMVARPANFQELQQGQQPIDNGSSMNSIEISNTGAQRARIIPATPTAPAATSNGDEANTMEHIRQSMLTLHTLVSTIDSSVGGNTVLQSYNREYDFLNVASPIIPTVVYNSNAAQTVEVEGSILTPERRFFVGQWVDVKDTVQQWLEATVMNINQEQKLVFIHYNGW